MQRIKVEIYPRGKHPFPLVTARLISSENKGIGKELPIILKRCIELAEKVSPAVVLQRT
jgi:hypothetical protein